MSTVQPVNGQQFEAEVVNSTLPVVVDFYASWCPPCRALAPILDRLATEFAGQIKFVKVDSDAEPALASQYQVTGLPTLVFLENGETIGQSAGLPPEAALREQLSQWLNSSRASSQ